jgi:hypothetical protein
MSIIVAPPSPSGGLCCAKSILGANGLQLDIFGHYLPNYLPDECKNLTNPYTFLNQGNLYDVSSITENHEVVLIGYTSQANIASATTYYVDWYRRRDNLHIAGPNVINIGAPPTGNVYPPQGLWGAWIGWCAEDLVGGQYPGWREIQENGDYYTIVNATGGENFTQIVEFAIKGMPPSTVVRNVMKPQFDWIINLSEYFDSVSYIRVGVCSEPFTSGQYEEPTGIINYVTAPSSNRGAAASGSASQVVDRVYGFAQTVDGRYWSTGSDSTGMVERPYNWEWYASKTTGQDYYVSATEWNDFMLRVLNFEVYKGVFPYGWTNAQSGSNFDYTKFNEARNNIARMITTSVPTVKTGDTVYAWYFNQLRDDLNSIT